MSRISALPVAAPPQGDEFVPIVQGNKTLRASVADLTDAASIRAESARDAAIAFLNPHADQAAGEAATNAGELFSFLDANGEVALAKRTAGGSELLEDYFGVDRVVGAARYVADREAMKLLTSARARARPVFLMEGVPMICGRMGWFMWDASIPVAEHQADTTESMLVAPDPAAPGAWKRLFHGPVYAEWGGACPNDPAAATPNRVTIQAMLDFLLGSSEIRRAALTLGDGKFYINGELKQFDLFDPEDRASRGKIRIEGQGQLSLTDGQAAEGAAHRNEYGTILYFTHLSGEHGLNWSPDNADGTYKRRFCGARSLSIDYAGTGYGIHAHSCPEMYAENVTVRCRGQASNGVYARNNWNADWRGMVICAIKDAGNTGKGLVVYNDILGGNFTFDGVINGFGICFYQPPGSAKITEIRLRSGAIQKWTTKGILIEGQVGAMELGTYAETGLGGGFFAVSASGFVSTLNGESFFILGGDEDGPWMTEPAFDLRNVATGRLACLDILRPWMGIVMQRDSKVTIENVTVRAAGATLPAGPLYLLQGGRYEEADKDAQGNLPGGAAVGDEIPGETFNVANIDIPNDPRIALYDQSKHRLTQFDGSIAMHHNVSVGKFKEVTIAGGVAYDMGNDPDKPGGIVAFQDSTSLTSVRLPAASGHTVGLVRTVVNKAGSSGDIALKDGANTTTIATVPPGWKAVCWILDIGGVRKWMLELSQVVIAA